MTCKVVLIGCQAVVLRAYRGTVVRMAPEDIYRDSFAGCTGVVLGANAMTRLDPAVAWNALVAVRSRVVLCADVDLAYGIVLPWVTCGFSEPTSLDDLPGRIALLDHKHVRPWLADDRWLPQSPAAGSEAAIAVAAVFRLRRMDVNVWAARLGWSRDRLGDICERSFGISAKHALLCFAAIAYGDMRTDGATDEDCAQALGYFDAPTLKRAIGRAEAADRRTRTSRKRPSRAPQTALSRRSRVVSSASCGIRGVPIVLARRRGSRTGVGHETAREALRRSR